MKISQSRAVAATTPSDQIESGSPEEAYQAINRARMLWSFRRRDVKDWKEVIDRWAKEPKAWHRIPEIKPYGTAKAMIEAEVCESYTAFLSFVSDIVGTEYAAKLEDDLGERGGNNNSEGINQYTAQLGQPYVHKVDLIEKESSYGSSVAYLRKRLKRDAPEILESIGKGKQYETVTEAAQAVGIAKKRERLCMYADDPVAAGRYLAYRVDKDWLMECVDAYMKEEQP